MCFKCGKYGHKKELCLGDCKENDNGGYNDANEVEPTTNALRNINMADDFRVWIIV